MIPFLTNPVTTHVLAFIAGVATVFIGIAIMTHFEGGPSE
jgi:hypothetical protein